MTLFTVGPSKYLDAAVYLLGVRFVCCSSNPFPHSGNQLTWCEWNYMYKVRLLFIYFLAPKSFPPVCVRLAPQTQKASI